MTALSTQSSKAVFLLLLAVLLLGGVLHAGLSGLGWHDQQRVVQSVLLCLAALYCLCQPLKQPVAASLSPLSLGLGLILSLGLLSSLLAAYPAWALKEWGRYAGLLLLLGLLAEYARERWLAAVLSGLLALIGFLLAFQFLLLYAMAFATGILRFDVDLFYSGFANPRFLNQFQILLVPVLAGLVVQLHGWTAESYRRHARLVAWLLFVALVAHWCLALALGGRGFLLGVAVSHLAVCWFLPRFRKLVFVQAVAALLGWCLYQLLFFVIPAYVGQDALVMDSLRAGLSRREEIWAIAWRMFLAHPWLGAGPLHFSAQTNPVAAHPHQVILQWLAEWGIFATVTACTLIFLGMRRGWQLLRSESAQVMDASLWLSLCGALLLAQVDGVFVMPYTETWLVILAALALARWARVSPGVLPGVLLQNTRWQHVAGRRPGRWFVVGAHKLLALGVILILGKVLLLEVPERMQQAEAGTQMSHVVKMVNKPRFWQHGGIP